MSGLEPERGSLESETFHFFHQLILDTINNPEVWELETLFLRPIPFSSNFVNLEITRYLAIFPQSDSRNSLVLARTFEQPQSLTDLCMRLIHLPFPNKFKSLERVSSPRLAKKIEEKLTRNYRPSLIITEASIVDNKTTSNEEEKTYVLFYPRGMSAQKALRIIQEAAKSKLSLIAENN
jgi:hypothetical protein